MRTFANKLRKLEHKNLFFTKNQHKIKKIFTIINTNQLMQMI